MSPLSEGIIKRLTLARYLFRLASDHASLHRGVASYACINLLQDALEIFLVAAAERVQALVSSRTDFAQYLDLINAKLSPNELPFRARLLEINRMRINSKHHAIAPNATELTGHVKNARDFFDQSSTQLFARDFWTISLVALLNDGEKKELMTEAESAFEQGKFLDCLIACRKAFFLEFEAAYDIRRLRMASKAPQHARDREWREKNVRDPFDYIVLDRSRLDADLMKAGLDNGIFWNIHRLTPDVYRGRKEKVWAVKDDPNKLRDEGAQDRAAYVLENTIDLILKTEANKRAVRSVEWGFVFSLTLRAERTTLYRRADKDGEILGLTPSGMTEVQGQYSTRGLRDEELYWRVTYEDAQADEGGRLFRDGYILASDLVDDES